MLWFFFCCFFLKINSSFMSLPQIKTKCWLTDHTNGSNRRFSVLPALVNDSSY